MAMSELPTGTVTFLFTDIEGSTRLWEEHPEEMQGALSRHDEILRSVIEQHDGHVFSRAGDSFAGAFHTASNALAAAFSAQRALRGESETGLHLLVRMAVHSGEAQERDGNYFGQPLNRGARLLAAGHGGQIVVSRATEELITHRLPEGAELIDLGEHRLRDLSRPERIFQLVHPELPRDFPPLATLELVPNNLPTQLISFVGREQERAEVLNALTGSRLVTLVGPGGAGKTRLALEVAADTFELYEEGVWFVDLAPLVEPHMVVKAVASSLKLPEQPGLELGSVLAEYLRSRKVLVVLDNCEHLVEAAASLAAELLSHSQKPRILATSQERLRVPGEVTVQVTAMEVPPAAIDGGAAIGRFDAVRLFAQRGEVALPGFRVTDENAGAVAQICRRLDGLPLAIELAAARLTVLTPEGIARRLDERFVLLTGGRRTALPRQQTLRAAINWSHGLLDEEERTLFRRLSVFVGDFDMDAVEDVCPTADLLRTSVLETFARLLDKSLVVVRASEQERRYGMLETIRKYADERLVEAGEQSTVRDRHARYYQRLSVVGRDGLLGLEAPTWFRRLHDARDNLHTALGWLLESDRPDLAVPMASALGAFWLLSRRIVEGLWWLRQVVEATRDVATVERVEVLGWAGTLAHVAAEQEEAVAFAQGAVELADRLDDPLGRSIADLHRGLVEVEDTELAISLLASAADGLERADNPWVLWARTWVGYHQYLGGKPDDAAATLSATLAEARTRGQLITVQSALHYLGSIAALRGNFTEASRLHEENLQVAHELGSTWGLTGALNSLARDRLRTGDLQEAVDLFRKSIELMPGNILTLTGAHAWLAEALFRADDIHGSRRALRESLEYARRAAQGRQVWALHHPLLVSARLAHQQGKPDLATRLYGALDQLLREMGVGVHEPEQEEWAAQIRSTVGDRQFDRLAKEGAALPLDQAIESALEELTQHPT
jgi:predicted ATPase/class 3 adenylate cyclase